jgi:hypothetical protein
MENSAPLVATSKENQNSQKFRIVPVMEWVTNTVKTLLYTFNQNLPLVTLTFTLLFVST